MGILFSRRRFLGAPSAAAVIPRAGQIVEAFRSDKVLPEKEKASSNKAAGRIVDVHVHFDAKKPNYIDDFLKVSDRLNLTACLLTPFANRKLVAEAAKQHATQSIPLGFVDLDAPDVVEQGKNFTPWATAALVNWSSGRMRPIHLEEIARRFPKITVLGAHCGNPEYEWAAEIARWNPNVFFDLSGSTLTKMHGRLTEFQKIFWWSATEWRSAEWTVKTPNNDPSAFVKIVFASDTDLGEIEAVVNQYRAMFDACDVPERTRKMIMGGTLRRMLGLPD